MFSITTNINDCLLLELLVKEQTLFLLMSINGPIM